MTTQDEDESQNVLGLRKSTSHPGFLEARMKRYLVFFALLTVLFLVDGAAQQAAAELNFTFTRQSGAASNQFAVWIEDTGGRLIKTLYATRYTANGGWRQRATSIPVWVRQSGLSGMTSAQIDALTGATPRTGRLTYTWDGTDSRGTVVPNGDYYLILEGTLRWGNQVIYRAPVKLGRGPAETQVSVEYTGDATSERAMISDVTVQILR